MFIKYCKISSYLCLPTMKLNMLWTSPVSKKMSPVHMLLAQSETFLIFICKLTIKEVI